MTKTKNFFLTETPHGWLIVGYGFLKLPQTFVWPTRWDLSYENPAVHAYTQQTTKGPASRPYTQPVSTKSKKSAGQWLSSW